MKISRVGLSNMAMVIIRAPITRHALRVYALDRVSGFVKAVLDVRQGIMAVGGEFHADGEVFLSEQAGSLREDTWGINLYLEKTGNDFIEFDSMINIKPSLGNRSRSVEDISIQNKIKEIIQKLVV